MKFNLEKFDPCIKALEYYNTKSTFLEAWNDCDRGDWMLWIASKLKVDHRKLTLAKSRCAKLIFHLMTDQRSKISVEVAEKYGMGEATKEQLDKAAHDAYTAAYAADADAAFAAEATASDAVFAAEAAASAADAAASAADSYAASDASAASATASAAAYAAASDASVASDAAFAADAYATHASAAATHASAAAAYDTANYDAKQKTLLKCADICREILTDEILKKINE